jgi:chromosome segregation ATPase
VTDATDKTEADATRAATVMAKTGGLGVDDGVAHLEAQAQAADQRRAQAREERKTQHEAFMEQAQRRIRDRRRDLEPVTRELEEAERKLEEAWDRGASAMEIAALENSVTKASEVVAAATALVDEALAEEARLEEEFKQNEVEARRADAKERKKEKSLLSDAKAEMESSKGRQLSFAPTSTFFAGLATLVGKCKAEPGEHDILMEVMANEHVSHLKTSQALPKPFRDRQCRPMSGIF